MTVKERVRLRVKERVRARERLGVSEMMMEASEGKGEKRRGPKRAYKHTYSTTIHHRRNKGCWIPRVSPPLKPHTKYEYLLLVGFVDDTDVRSRFRCIPRG